MQSSFDTQKETSDLHRPRYHFLPEANWLNDPNGVIHWQGQYHLFYQYNPNGPFWGTIHWGHAVSTDLVHWQHLPLALSPSPDTADAEGCWSGYAVNNNGVPTLIYTGISVENNQRPCLATSHDNLISWHKYEGNPIIADPPPDLEVLGFRDHCLWQEADGNWYQVIGTGLKDGQGSVLLYRSPDLYQWEYVHQLYSGVLPSHQDHDIWECPDFFGLGDPRRVLFVSSTGLSKVIYFVGDYTLNKFEPNGSYQFFDRSGYLYAPQSLQDEQGRRLMWGWLREGRSPEAQREAGWSGVMSLPLLLSLKPQPDDRLGIAFAPELEVLRGKSHALNRAEVESGAGKIYPLADIAGECLEIQVEFDPTQNAEFGLILRATPDGAEQTRLSYDPVTQQLRLDCSRSSLSEEVRKEVYLAEHSLDAGEGLKLHIFLDRSVIELVANGHTYLSGRIYPTRSDARQFSLFSQSDKLRVTRLEAWELGAVWP